MSHGISLGGSAERKRKKKRGRHASGRATPQRRGVAPRPHTVDIGEARTRSDVARHAMKYEGAGLGTTGLAAAHGFLSKDVGPQRKRFKPIAAIEAPPAMPSAQARIRGHLDTQLGMALPRGDFGHGHEKQITDEISRAAHEADISGGMEQLDVSDRPSPIPEAVEPYEHGAALFHHTSQLDPEGSKEDEPINLGRPPTNVPIADVGPADVGGGQQQAYVGGDDFLEADEIDAKAQNMLNNIGHAEKFADLGDAYHFADTSGRHEAATSHSHHDHAIRATNQRDDENDRAEQYLGADQTPGGVDPMSGVANPFANVGGAPPIVRQGAHPTDPFAGGSQFQYVRGGSPAPEGSGVPLIHSEAEFMRNVAISPSPEPQKQTMSDKAFMEAMGNLGPSMQEQITAQTDKDAQIAAAMAGGDLDLETQEPMEASLPGASGAMASALDEIEAGQLRRHASKALGRGPRGYSGEDVHAADDFTTAQIDAAARAGMPGGGRGVGTAQELARAAAIPSARSDDPHLHTDEKTSVEIAGMQARDAETLARQQARDDPHSIGAQAALGDAQLDPQGWERQDYLMGGIAAGDIRSGGRGRGATVPTGTDPAGAVAGRRGRGRGRVRTGLRHPGIGQPMVPGRRQDWYGRETNERARAYQRNIDATYPKNHPMHSRNGGFNGPGAAEWHRRGQPPWPAPGRERHGTGAPRGGLSGMIGKIKLEDPLKPPKKPKKRSDTPALWGWSSPELNPKKKRMITPWGGGGIQQDFDPIKPPVRPPIPPPASPPRKSPTGVPWGGGGVQQDYDPIPGPRKPWIPPIRPAPIYPRVKDDPMEIDMPGLERETPYSPSPQPPLPPVSPPPMVRPVPYRPVPIPQGPVRLVHPGGPGGPQQGGPQQGGQMGGGHGGQMQGGQAQQQGGPPIVTTVLGGGGAPASSSASGGAASGGGGGHRGPPIIIAPAKKKPAAKKKAGAKRKQTGVTQARKQYTAKRKQKMAQLRSAKARKIKEFNAKTKKMPKAQRDKARRAFKAKVNKQMASITSKFPTARGITDIAKLNQLIRQADSIRA